MADFVECKNGVWQHFLREKGGQAAQCKLCKTKLKNVGGSTKGLHEHLKRVHQIMVKEATVFSKHTSTFSLCLLRQCRQRELSQQLEYCARNFLIVSRTKPLTHCAFCVPTMATCELKPGQPVTWLFVLITETNLLDRQWQLYYLHTSYCMNAIW